MATTNSQPQFGANHFDKIAARYDENRDTMSKMAAGLITAGTPITSESIVLDNACGPGIVTGEILRSFSPRGIHAADISPAMIDIVRKKDWPVKAEVMDAQALTYPDAFFSHVYMNMGIFLIPDAEKGASEMHRVLKPGGSAIVTSIKQVGWVRIFQEAQQRVKAGNLWKGPLREEWSTEQKLRDVLRAGGFENVEVSVSEAVQPGKMVATFIESMRESMTKSVTGSWTGDEKARFEVELNKILKKEAENPRDFEVIAFVGVAMK